jgi:CNT family concentrative nucleoside transporter
MPGASRPSHPLIGIHRCLGYNVRFAIHLGEPHVAAISFLGLLFLLALAWMISFQRKHVQIKPIAWGLGLQLVFALIILRKDVFSFVGMGLLGLLLCAYVFRPLETTRRFTKDSLLKVVVALLMGVALYALGGFMPLWGVAILALMALMTLPRWRPQWSPWISALLVAALIAAMVRANLTGSALFQNFSDQVAGFLNLSDYGARFLFGNLANPQTYGPTTLELPTGPVQLPGFGFQFAFKVLPTIVFFGGFMGCLYYLGIMQRIIETISRFMRWTIGTSGAETLSCSANIFVGQTEAPLLIKPFIADMTESELLTIMVGGFATIAGGVLAGYIAMGVPAGHLIAASVMSAPAALVIGKIIYPELEHSKTAGDVPLPSLPSGSNLLEAASNGITDGLKLAVNVGAMLVGFIALIAVVDWMLGFLDYWVDGQLLQGTYIAYAAQDLSPAIGEYQGIIPGSLRAIFGVILQPLAWIMGVPRADLAALGNLLGIKLTLNEFVAFGTLGSYIQEGTLSERGVVIATYALCGFANFSSIGIQIGGISALVPEKRPVLAKLGLRAMIGGALASWTTATIAGIFL